MCVPNQRTSYSFQSRKQSGQKLSSCKNTTKFPGILDCCKDPLLKRKWALHQYLHWCLKKKNQPRSWVEQVISPVRRFSCAVSSIRIFRSPSIRASLQKLHVKGYSVAQPESPAGRSLPLGNVYMTHRRIVPTANVSLKNIASIVSGFNF